MDAQQNLDEHESQFTCFLDSIDMLVQEGKIQNAMVISALYFFHNIHKK